MAIGHRHDDITAAMLAAKPQVGTRSAMVLHQKGAWISRATRDAVCGAYEALAMTPGPPDKTRRLVPVTATCHRWPGTTTPSMIRPRSRSWTPSRSASREGGGAATDGRHVAPGRRSATKVARRPNWSKPSAAWQPLVARTVKSARGCA